MGKKEKKTRKHWLELEVLANRISLASMDEEDKKVFQLWLKSEDGRKSILERKTALKYLPKK